MTDQTGAWSFPIEWAKGFGEEFRFRTEIITSRNGTEQRIAQRQNPRMAYDFESFLNFDDYREAHLRLSKNQGQAMAFPHPRYHTTTTSLIEVGHNDFAVAANPGWIKAGDVVFLDDGDKIEAVEVAYAAGVNLGASSAIDHQFAAGTKVFRGVQGYFSAESKLKAATSRVGLSQVEFDADPIRTYHEALTRVPETYRGKEFFDFGPQWGSSQKVEFVQPVLDLNLQRGDVDRLHPIKFTNRKYRLRFVVRNDEHFNRLVGLFYRCRGRAKSFYMPLIGDEIRPQALLPGNVFTVPGVDFARQYAELNIFRTIQIKTAEYELTTGVTQITPSANGSVVTTQETIPASATGNQIKSMRWVGLCRFESDTLNLEWITAGVAETTVNIRTLEDPA